MIVVVAKWIKSLLGRIVLSACLAASVIGWRALDIHKQRGIGEKRSVAKIKKANENATRIGRRAAQRSGAPGVRGAIDPSTRND